MAYIHLDTRSRQPQVQPILGYIHLDTAGKPCGKGWIAAGYNCSPDKRAYTKKYRQADRDKAAKAIRDERRKAKGYKEEVKSVDDFIKNIDVLQEESRGSKPQDTDDWGSIKLSDMEKQAEEGQTRMYKKAGMSEEDAKKEAAKNMRRMKSSMPLKGENENLKEKDVKNLDLNEGEQTTINGIIHEVIGGELIPLEGTQALNDLLAEEEAGKAKKQQQQAQKQAEKRRKAAERQAKAADKKISQLDKRMQRGQTGRKKLSVNEELKLAEEKFKTQSDRQAALENIIQATLAAQQSRQVGGKSGIAPFSGQSIRDRRALEQSLRNELNKLSNLSSEADAANQLFEMNRKLKEESAGMKDVVGRSKDLVRKSRIEKMKRMWGLDSPDDFKLDSIIEAAAANKTAFEQRFPTRQISIPANTSLVGYLSALAGMARGDSAIIKEYSVVGSSYHADSISDVAFADGCYRLRNTQDKFIRI